jgi:hypothetical protein
MGTRSVTRILDGNQEICRVYRQYDGCPTGMSLDLARICDRKITNGISCSQTGKGAAEAYRTSNGMG